MRVISLGWGVQSFTLAAMASMGELPPIDAAIHADTTHEASATYAFAAKWTPWLEERGVHVVTVRDHDPRIKTDRVGGRIFIPAFTATPEDRVKSRRSVTDPDTGQVYPIPARGGQLRRQCTQRWKVAPIRRWLQANRAGQPVEMWLGISLDEIQRMKPSNRKYVTHRWPLIERRMTRDDCEAWLTGNGLEVPPKSACTFCPYRDRAGWAAVAAVPEDLESAIRVDELIRGVRSPHELFVHPSRVPLRLAVSLDAQDSRADECAGICFV